MSRTVFVNGRFLPEQEATISIFDRGFLMADGVYEVTAVIDGKLIDFYGHMKRLERSLGELKIANNFSANQWLAVHRELVRLNEIQHGLVYLQVTRGNPGDRDFRFPDSRITPTLIAFTQAKPDLLNPSELQGGWKVISIPDLRWGRRDIKTTQLLYPSIGKMMAVEAGVNDAWFVEDGWVTEGTSNNAYILSGNQLITRQLGHDILHGITRTAVIQFATRAGLQVVERPFTVEEVVQAEEAFVTSATALVMPVVQIDGQNIGKGLPGARTLELREVYLERMLESSI